MKHPGSIKLKRPGKYLVRVSWREGGAVRSRAKVVNGNEADALGVLVDLMKVKARRPTRGEETVPDYLREWSPRRPVRPATLRWKRWVLESYVSPAFPTTRLADLSDEMIVGLFVALAARGLSGGTLRHVHVNLKAALADAVRAGLLEANPMADMAAPKVTRQEMKTLSPDECRALLQILDTRPPVQRVLFLVALATGLRPEEYLALTWRDVDTGNGFIHVRRALDRDGGFQDCKTPKSRRTLPIGTNVREALIWLRPEVFNSDDLVFNEEGRPFREGRVARWLKRILRLGGLPLIRLYDLRHTCATLLLIRGVNPKVVSEWLGHASVAITLDTYSHVTPGLRAEAMRHLEEVLFDGENS